MAGVVSMTASRAINGSGYVSKEVRERVMQAARKLNYRPNMVARQLRGNRLNAIGVMLPDIANPFSAELVQGLSDIFGPAGYTAFIATANHSVEQETSGLQAFIDHRIDGLVIATHNTKVGDEALEAIARQGIPTVTIGRPVEIPSVDCVTANDWQGAFDAVTHLTKLGHVRIGFVGCSADEEIMLPRFGGYKAAIETSGHKLIPELAVGRVIAPGYATEEDGFSGMMKLAKLKRPPTAIFARNDLAAIGALRAANVLKLRVPQDVAIAGFDNLPLAAFQTPPLTTVEQPIREQGRAAAVLLLRRIQGQLRAPRKTIQMKCTLIVRQSTDPTAA
jgi:DNA-binding LacI/PurR family transcriptional regulator